MKANKYNREFIKSKLENVKKEFNDSRNSELSSIYDIPPDIDLDKYHDIYELRKDFNVRDILLKRRLISEHYEDAIIAVELTDDIIEELLKEDVIVSVYCETETPSQDIYRPNIIFLKSPYGAYFEISLEWQFRREIRKNMIKAIGYKSHKRY